MDRPLNFKGKTKVIARTFESHSKETKKLQPLTIQRFVEIYTALVVPQLSRTQAVCVKLSKLYLKISNPYISETKKHQDVIQIEARHRQQIVTNLH